MENHVLQARSQDWGSENFDGKNQVFQFGANAKTKDQLCAIAQQAVDKLSAGDSIDNVHTWVIAKTENVIAYAGMAMTSEIYPYAAMVMTYTRMRAWTLLHPEHLDFIPACGYQH